MFSLIDQLLPKPIIPPEVTQTQKGHSRLGHNLRTRHCSNRIRESETRVIYRTAMADKQQTIVELAGILNVSRQCVDAQLKKYLDLGLVEKEQIRRDAKWWWSVGDHEKP